MNVHQKLTSTVDVEWEINGEYVDLRVEVLVYSTVSIGYPGDRIDPPASHEATVDKVVVLRTSQPVDDKAALRAYIETVCGESLEDQALAHFCER